MAVEQERAEELQEGVEGGLEKGVILPDSSTPGLEKGLFPPLLLGAHVQNF